MLNIIIKEVKGFYREKANLFFFLMFPVMLIFLLGNLLGSMDKAEDVVGNIKLQYLVETQNPYQVMAIDQFIKKAGENKSLSFEEAKDLRTAKELAGKDEITAVIAFQGDPLKINIYEGKDRIKNRTVNAIINGFAQTDKSFAAVIKTIPDAALITGTEADNNFIKQKDLGVNRTMLDYYAVTMLAMICFLSIIQGTAAFTNEREEKTINRLFMAPQNRISVFLQKILGIVPKSILQITLLMFISVFVFNAHYASTFPDNIYLFFMFFMVTFAMVSIGVVIGLVIKANPMAVVFPPLWFMMFFGGTYSKELDTGIKDIMPIYQVQQAAFDLEIFHQYRSANMVILVSLITVVVMLAIGAFIYSRKEEER